MAYTEAQVAALTKAAPVSFEDAQRFAAEFGVSTQSVISKVLSLDLEYVKKDAPEAKAPRVTKADMVAAIAADLDLPADMLSGLTGATMAALKVLRARVVSDS